MSCFLSMRRRRRLRPGQDLRRRDALRFQRRRSRARRATTRSSAPAPPSSRRLLHRPLAGALLPVASRMSRPAASGRGRPSSRKICAVISMRNDCSSPLFQSSKTSASSSGSRAADACAAVVGLGDELHVAVLDAVVHHLDVVARRRPGRMYVDAGPVVDLRGDLRQDGRSASYASRSPPGIIDGPWRAPSSPPETPMPK